MKQISKNPYPNYSFEDFMNDKVAFIDKMNFLFHWSTVSVDWSNTFMNVGANKIKYWRRKIAAFPLIGAKFLNY